MGKLLEVFGAGATAANLNALSKRSGVPVERLKSYLKHESLPPRPDLDKLCQAAGVSPTQVMLALGKFDRQLVELISSNHAAVFEALRKDVDAEPKRARSKASLAFQTKLGRLYHGDCLALLESMDAESVDLVFADPPFNLKKLYPSKIDDDLKASKYTAWMENWLDECVRVLKPGGSLFLWNLPKWNAQVTGRLSQSLTFRHWISVDIKYSLPIAGRLYPSHYSLLYYCKGDAPKTFHPDRMPMEICPHCFEDLRDYGGYKDKMNPKGVNLSDVWFDIPPVRHAKYKRRKDANELSLRLMDRIIEMASDEGDTVFDPFGGAGTTYLAAELKRRKWIGVEIGPVSDIVSRLKNLDDERDYLQRIRRDYNLLFTVSSRRERERRGLWTAESVRKKKALKDQEAQGAFELEG